MDGRKKHEETQRDQMKREDAAFQDAMMKVYSHLYGVAPPDPDTRPRVVLSRTTAPIGRNQSSLEGL